MAGRWGTHSPGMERSSSRGRSPARRFVQPRGEQQIPLLAAARAGGHPGDRGCSHRCGSRSSGEGGSGQPGKHPRVRQHHPQRAGSPAGCRGSRSPVLQRGGNSVSQYRANPLPSSDPPGLLGPSPVPLSPRGCRKQTPGFWPYIPWHGLSLQRFSEQTERQPQPAQRKAPASPGTPARWPAPLPGADPRWPHAAGGRGCLCKASATRRVCCPLPGASWGRSPGTLPRVLVPAPTAAPVSLPLRQHQRGQGLLLLAAVQGLTTTLEKGI